jgi:hypothetical protein
MGLRHFALGFISCAMLFAGCAATFPYKYYWLSAESYGGRLLGQEPKDDVELSACIPTATDKNPCTVMFTPEYLALKQDHEARGIRIIELERELQQCGRRGD